MPKPVVKKAVLRLPQVETRRVWVGSYGGHFSVVVVFSKKPKKAGRQAFNPGEYCELLNKDIIAGKFAPDAFEVWFGVRIVATSTQIMSVEPYDLTAVWDDYGQVFGLNTPVD